MAPSGVWSWSARPPFFQLGRDGRRRPAGEEASSGPVGEPAKRHLPLVNSQRAVEEFITTTRESGGHAAGSAAAAPAVVSGSGAGRPRGSDWFVAVVSLAGTRAPSGQTECVHGGMIGCLLFDSLAYQRSCLVTCRHTNQCPRYVFSGSLHAYPALLEPGRGETRISTASSEPGS